MSDRGCEMRRADTSLWWFCGMLLGWLFAGLIGWQLCLIDADKKAADAVKDRPYLELMEKKNDS